VRRRERLAGVAAALLAVLAAIAPGAGAAGLEPLEPRVDGGAESWHAEPVFAVRWTNPARDGMAPLAAVHYRLLDPAGATLAEEEIGWPATSIQHLAVPAVPGAYRAEIRLEDASGARGDPVSVALRFDGARPGAVEPPSPPGWLGRGSFPYALRLGRPAGPEPLSGIRGYAVAIGAVPTSPCAGDKTCSETETDLRDGAAADLLRIGDLPEGTSHLSAVAVSGSGMRSELPGGAVLRVDRTDPVTRLAGAVEGWSRRALRLTATATDAASGMAPAGAAGPFTAIRVDGGPPTVAAGNSVSVSVIASGVHTVAHYARDAAGNAADGASVNGHPNPPPAIERVRIDREPPRLSFAAGQDPADPERVEAHAADAHSGIDPASGAIAVRQLGSHGPFTALPTVLANGALLARWDSESAPPGEYELRATVSDRAGNAAATLHRAGGAAMRLRAPLKVATTLLAGLDRRRRVLRGRLFAGRGAPLAGRTVRLVERFDAGTRRPERVTAVATGEGGRFRLRLRPGPSRRVLVTVAPTRRLRGTRSRELRVEAAGRVRLRVSRRVARIGGRPVVFRGAVAARGASLPAGGKLVQLQFSLPGLPWREFRTVRTDRRGRFRYAYRFADDDSRGVRFRFRAFAPAQEGWPFAPAGSRPLSIRGR